MSRLDDMPRPAAGDPSGHKGYDHWDYRIAVAVEGSVRGAARRMDVNRKTVKEMCKIHDIYVPTCGGVPGEGPAIDNLTTMDVDTLSTRTKAIAGELDGRRVRITVPYRGGQFAEIGTVSRVAYPLVEVDVGDQMRYRHVDDVELMD